MSMSLDVGTRAFRSLRRQGDRLIGRQNVAKYVVLPDRPQQRRLLESSSYRYAKCEESLLVIGHAATELGEALQVPEVPLLRTGQPWTDDPVARQVIASLIDSLLPRPSAPGEFCCIVSPSGGQAAQDAEFIRQLVRLNGYQPCELDAGTAIVLSEMAADGFTGMGISFGAGSTRVSLAHRGNPCLSLSIPQGGDWIDGRLAESESSLIWDSEGNRYLNLHAIATWKESSIISVNQPISDREQRIALLYEELFHQLLTSIGRQLRDHAVALSLPQPIPVVCSGGLTRVHGFIPLLERSLMEISLPLRISELRIAAPSEYTVARGCLIRAELEADAVQRGLSSVA